MIALLQVLADLLFPPKCMFCGEILEDTEECLCPACQLIKLPRYTGPSPKVKHVSRAVTVFLYESPVREAILRYKFRGLLDYRRQFAVWMAEAVRDRLEGKYDLISWVPCSRRRVWERGYDQSRLLAQALAEELGTEAVRTLKKVKHNKPQSKSHSAAQRRQNVRNVYIPWEPEQFRGKRILLVDDVLTTGATLSECGRTLAQAGAKDLVCVALAAATGEKISG